MRRAPLLGHPPNPPSSLLTVVSLLSPLPEPSYETVSPLLCPPLENCSLSGHDCPYGFQQDSNGCLLCQCLSSKWTAADGVKNLRHKPTFTGLRLQEGRGP